MAQTDPITPQRLDTIVLQSSRIKSNLQKLPAAVFSYKTTPADAARQQLALQEYLFDAPGVFTQNANNFAQDLRISIRGFGARSAFGIRGIKLIVDGIPETTPDGQGQLDNLNLGIIDNIEVIKGPSSSLYGNASGGVIVISTIDQYKNKDISRPNGTVANGVFRLKPVYGSYGFQQYQATAGFGTTKANYLLHGSYATSDGYRDQSGFEQYNFNGKSNFRVGEDLKITGILNYSNSPVAEDAGGLTLEEVEANRRQARSRNVDFQTEEDIQQLKIGTSIQWEINDDWQLNNYQFYNYRDFNGLLPFEFGGIIDLQRNYIGHGTSVNYKVSSNTLSLGYDIGYQNDNRRRFFNLEGIQGGQTLNQQERFTAIGVYAIDHFTVNKWLFTAGLRYDYNQIEVEDRLLANGNDSGDIVLNTINPSIGVSFEWFKNHQVYTTLSTSFETPALSELSADPDGGQGFNEDLDPQRAINYEIGFKGSPLPNLSYQLALFLIDTQDDLVPFELEAFPDRTFFRNAGRTRRQGIEIAAQYAFAIPMIIGTWNATASYTYSDFEYRDFVLPNGDFSGNVLPGIPRSTTSFQLRYGKPKGFNASVQSSLVGRLYANDSNTVVVDGYELINLRLGYTIALKKMKILPFFGINNLFDTTYNDNVRINAFGGRFFEPAPGINGYGGVSFEF